MADAPIPIYRYTITLTDGTERTVDAIGYVDDEPWFIFNDIESTVLTILIGHVVAIQRGPAIAHQPVETL